MEYYRRKTCVERSGALVIVKKARRDIVIKKEKKCKVIIILFNGGDKYFGCCRMIRFYCDFHLIDGIEGTARYLTQSTAFLSIHKDDAGGRQLLVTSKRGEGSVFVQRKKNRMMEN